jgi:3-phenylpropionate/trans-cinnamate dioxygenase ferredoxin reductase subunit
MPDQTTTDVLIIGGGVAGASAAAKLRAAGFDGSVLLVTRELDEPYERPPVTKGLLRGEMGRGEALIHPPDWWADNNVELRTRTGVMGLDTENRTATLASKDVVSFKHAILATGAMVRRLQVDGARLEGIHYLRAPGNAESVRTDFDAGDRVVIVGGSYIACEVAASLTSIGKTCTMVMQEQHPLERGFGTAVGEWVARRLADRGVELLGGVDVESFAGEGRVDAVVTSDGRRVEADLVIVGVGAVPDVMLAKKAGLEIGESGGIACSANLQTSADGVYAAGDACEYDSVLHGRRLRIEHHEHAAAQGRTAARNVAGAGEPHADVPYFWTDLGDWATLEYVGACQSWDTESVEGDITGEQFTVRYEEDGKLVAALSCGDSAGLDQARKELGKRGREG